MKPLNNFLSKTLFYSLFTYSSLTASSNGFYFEGAVGLGLSDSQECNHITYTYEQAYSASFALGYQKELWRFELQQRYKSDELYSQSIDGSYQTKVDGKLTNSSQMFNLYYSGYNQSNFLTTVGLGVGISAIEVEKSFSESNILSTQALFSIGYQIRKDFIISGNYAYFYTFEADNFQAKGDNTLSLSLRYIF